MAKDRKPAGSSASRASATRSGGNRTGGNRPGNGRTRPPTNVVAQQRPWGLIAGAMVVVLFAAAVITYAVLQVHKANAEKISSPSQISGLHTYKYAAGQQHVTTPVDYQQSPPVGGAHDPYWADCNGTVYTKDIRHENAVHGLEHGAVWITYNPDKVSKSEISTLAALVDGHNYRYMSPYAGLDSPISVQSWNHQLKVDKASDKRIKQFADFFTQNSSYYPEIGASCDNPDFKANPVLQGQPSEAVGSTDAPTSAPMPAPASSSAP